jgi:hypothetical protein
MVKVSTELNFSNTYVIEPVINSLVPWHLFAIRNKLILSTIVDVLLRDSSPLWRAEIPKQALQRPCHHLLFEGETQ